MRVRLVALESGLDLELNREAAVVEVRDAVAAGADLVVFPEYAAVFDPHGVGIELAEPLDGPFVTALANESREETAVLVGTATPGPDRRALNVVVALRDGVIAGEYVKVHLYDAFGMRESEKLMPGPADSSPLVLDVLGVRVGVMTCYDLRFGESARRLVDAGAHVLVVPAAWAAGVHKLDHWRTLLRARAIENVAWVLGVPMRGRGLVGEPIAIDPWGQVVAEGVPVVDVQITVESVLQARRENPSLDNRRYRVVPRS
jgi:deaminated glutathione amidase